MLNSIRVGDITKDVEQVLLGLNRRVPYQDGIEPMELYPTRSEAEGANLTRLGLLPGPTMLYEAKDWHKDDGSVHAKSGEKRGEYFERIFMAPRNLQLKKGCSVMLVKNLEQGLVNGSIGICVGFSSAISFQPTTAIDGRRKWRYFDGPLLDSEREVELALVQVTPEERRLR